MKRVIVLRWVHDSPAGCRKVSEHLVPESVVKDIRDIVRQSDEFGCIVMEA